MLQHIKVKVTSSYDMLILVNVFHYVFNKSIKLRNWCIWHCRYIWQFYDSFVNLKLASICFYTICCIVFYSFLCNLLYSYKEGHGSAPSSPSRSQLILGAIYKSRPNLAHRSQLIQGAAQDHRSFQQQTFTTLI